MISEVVMPQMGADMTEGTLVRWMKSEGDAVTRGEIIAEIETDKANVEIEAFEGGVFRKALAHEGDVIQVGEVIAVIAAPEDDIAKYANGGSASAPAPKATPTDVTAPPAPPSARASTLDVAPPPENGRVRASPLARKIAAERGIDLRQVRGSGPGGRIVKKDVAAGAGAPSLQAAAAATPPASTTAAQPTAAAPSKMRQAIARRMAQSKREAPHYYLLLDIDMSDAMAVRSQINNAVGEDARVSVNDLIVRACALALQEHPEFNAVMDGERIVQSERQNVCIAIAMDDGLIAPAIVDAGAKTVAQIAAASKDLVDRAKNGALKADEITAGTFTITNLGAYGIETLIGIIQPPQTAILGVGSVMARPGARDGQVVVRQMMKVALSADHRVTDGAQGARFVGEIRRLLEAPVLLFV